MSYNDPFAPPPPYYAWDSRVPQDLEPEWRRIHGRTSDQNTTSLLEDIFLEDGWANDVIATDHCHQDAGPSNRGMSIPPSPPSAYARTTLPQPRQGTPYPDNENGIDRGEVTPDDQLNRELTDFCVPPPPTSPPPPENCSKPEEKRRRGRPKKGHESQKPLDVEKREAKKFKMTPKQYRDYKEWRETQKETQQNTPTPSGNSHVANGSTAETTADPGKSRWSPLDTPIVLPNGNLLFRDAQTGEWVERPVPKPSSSSSPASPVVTKSPKTEKRRYQKRKREREREVLEEQYDEQIELPPKKVAPS